MSRAAFLPFPGDPFLLHYWLTFYDRFWADEVDWLYVLMNSSIEPEVVEYCRKICQKRPKVIFLHNSTQIEHGMALKALLDGSSEDHIMFIEDDGFIFKKGQVGECFSRLESGEFDIVGSKRGSCSTEILNRAEKLWGITQSGEGDQGCNFWPNFFFTTRDKLLSTDQWFGAKTWPHNERIEALSVDNDDYQVQGELAVGDTFVHASLQLQKSTPQSRIKYIPQYHGSPDDLDHQERNYNLFDGVAPWCHIGSLSSGVGGLLQDGHGRSLARRLIDPSTGDNVPIPNYCHTDQERNEFERRVQWWLTFYQKREIGEIDEFADLYIKAIDAIIEQYGLSRSRIERRQKAYERIGL